MDRSAFTLLAGMEQSWWYRARTRAVRIAMRRIPVQPAKILDFGAGFGGMLNTLSSKGAQVYAYEPDRQARAKCLSRGYAGVFATTEEAFSKRYDAICLFDVLEHIDDDERFLREAHTALSEKGALILTVPAFQFLWSSHDVEHQHHRRYSASLLSTRTSANGYKTYYISYWNMLLFLPAAFMRLVGKTGESSLALPKSINSLFLCITWVESLWMYVSSLPFGTGLVAVVQKNENSALKAP